MVESSPMAIVTLLTDSGESDHYVAAIKAKILSVNPGLTLVDITHQVAPCDIAHGAFVLKSVFRDFPAGTVHLTGVDSAGNKDDAYIALQLEDHFFVGVDNGMLGLISDKNHQQVVQLNSINPIRTTFPEKDIFAPTAAKLASGVAITTLGKPLSTFKKMTDRHVKANKRIIAGNVIEKFRRIHKNYFEAEPGDCVLIFNSLGLLEIGMYKGHASELLGLKHDSPVNITFDESTPVSRHK